MKNQTTENYVKGIYKLQQKRESVPTSLLAKHLDVADGSVTDMLKKLSRRKLIRYTPYKGVSLTESGLRLALKMVRRHRLWEMFLVRYLGYRWDEIHQEAEELEHVTSEEMERRLDKALGHPRVDPHGDPIPNARGILETDAASPLGEFAVGAAVKIVRVSDEHAAILQHATKLGLHLDRKITVHEKQTFDGSMIIMVGSKKQFISERVARAIFAEPA